MSVLILSLITCGAGVSWLVIGRDLDLNGPGLTVEAHNALHSRTLYLSDV